MGQVACIANARPRAYADDMIKRAKEERKWNLDLLLLGISGSGKSTIRKQIQTLYGSFSDAEMANFRTVIQKNLIESAKYLSARFLDQYEGDDEELLKLLDSMMKLNPYNSEISPELGKDISRLWKNEKVLTYWEQNQFTFMHNVSHLMNKAISITRETYQPSHADILQARQSTTGVVETRCSVGKHMWHIVDVGGQRTERRKWLHFFNHVMAVIFIIAVDEYDVKDPEDKTSTKLNTALNLWKEHANMPVFHNKPMVVFLNKVDILSKRLKTTRGASKFMKQYPTVPKEPSTLEALQLIEVKVLGCVKRRDRHLIHCHATCALDTTKMSQVIDVVKDKFLNDRIATI